MRETYTSRAFVGEGGSKEREAERMKERKKKDERKRDESNDL